MLLIVNFFGHWVSLVLQSIPV